MFTNYGFCKRLLCESWVEKRPEVNTPASYNKASSSKQTAKWKTRYAMLVMSSETKLSEIRFYQKKSRSCTEITDDVIKLQPWEYTVDIPSWIIDKGRPHVLRLRILKESNTPGLVHQLQIAYQSSEEATAWMRCIQNQTKLTSGIQGHSFGVVAEDCSATARIGVAGKHCLLFVSPSQVILAHKTDRSVVCVWPFETIRSYATDDDRRLVIEAGRCAPLGEGVYSFRTRENDDNVLFDLFDHYTTTAIVEPPKQQPKSGLKVSRTNSQATALQHISKTKKGQKLATRQDSDRLPLISSGASSSNSEYDEPPKKPPLPNTRLPVSHFPVTNSPVLPAKSTSSPKLQEIAFDKKVAGSKQTNRCLYELDKLLHNLEGDTRPNKENVSDFGKSPAEGADNTTSLGSSSQVGLVISTSSFTESNELLAQDCAAANPSLLDASSPYAKIDCSKKKGASLNG